MTTPKRREKTFTFAPLDGGLNLRDAEINLKNNESPEMENLWWEDGGLRSRPGQQVAASGWGGGSYSGYQFGARDIVYAAAGFEEGIVAHIGASLYTWHGRFSELRRVDGLSAVVTGVPRNAGTFFRSGGALYYKNIGGFFRLTYDARHSTLASPFTLTRVADNAYIPTVLVNADPASGKGDEYESPNCLSPFKRVLYTPTASRETAVRTGNGLQRAFVVGATAAQNLRGVSAVYADNALLKPALYSADIRTGTVIFNAPPAEGVTLTFELAIGALSYKLPEENVSDVAEVKVDGLTMTPGSDYTADLSGGVVTFAEAPPASGANAVAITYSKADAAALAEVTGCPCAGTAGDGTIFVGGALARPNAVRCSGLAGGAPDASYWPLDAKTFVGGGVTAFGGSVVFQPGQIGRLTPSFQSVNGARRVSLAYSAIHETVGCDLPGSVRFVGNHWLFANKSGGVYQLRENGAARLSEKVNGSDTRPGLLYDFRVAGSAPVCSLDDGKRYWLAVNGHVWLWDYSVSDEKNPVWFYFTGLSPRALAMRDGAPLLLDTPRVVRLGAVYSDFGEPIRKVCQLPARNFGSYDRLKNVRSVLFSLRADEPSEVSVTYETDYETRADAVPLSVPGYDRLTERDLEVRDLSVPRRAAAFRRRPECRHVRHFAVRLENNAAGQDLAPYSVEIQVRYEGREK